MNLNMNVSYKRRHRKTIFSVEELAVHELQKENKKRFKKYEQAKIIFADVERDLKDGKEVRKDKLKWYKQLKEEFKNNADLKYIPLKPIEPSKAKQLLNEMLQIPQTIQNTKESINNIIKKNLPEDIYKLKQHVKKQLERFQSFLKVIRVRIEQMKKFLTNVEIKKWEEQITLIEEKLMITLAESILKQAGYYEYLKEIETHQNCCKRYNAHCVEVNIQDRIHSEHMRRIFNNPLRLSDYVVGLLGFAYEELINKTSLVENFRDFMKVAKGFKRLDGLGSFGVYKTK